MALLALGVFVIGLLLAFGVPWPLLALVIYLVGVVLALGMRTVPLWRRTGDGELRPAVKPVGSARWWARLLVMLALLTSLAGPITALAGLDPVPILDQRAIRVAGLILSVAGLAATMVAQLHDSETWRVDTDPAQRAALVTTGLFAIVRNPTCTAITTTGLGLALIVPNVMSFAAVALLVVAVHLQVRAVEEPHLRRVHGAAYTRYTRRVGRFLPGIGTIRSD